MHIKSGVIKRIHVNKQVIMANIKHGRNDPPVTVQTSRGPFRGREVTIHGTSKVIYSPNKPLNCGARLWIETTAQVTIE